MSRRLSLLALMAVFGLAVATIVQAKPHREGGDANGRPSPLLVGHSTGRVTSGRADGNAQGKPGRLSRPAGRSHIYPVDWRKRYHAEHAHVQRLLHARTRIVAREGWRQWSCCP